MEKRTVNPTLNRVSLVKHTPNQLETQLRAVAVLNSVRKDLKGVRNTSLNKKRTGKTFLPAQHKKILGDGATTHAV